MSLKSFLGRELPGALAALRADKVLGRWPGGAPGKLRQPARFDAAYYGENHAHAHAELCLLLEGRCHFSYAAKRVRLEPGDLVLCPPNLPHAESYQKPGEDYRLVWWILREDEPHMITTRYRRRHGFELAHRIALGVLPGEARSRLDWLRKTVAAGRRPELEALREALFTLTLALFRRVLREGAAQLDSRGVLVQRAADFVRAQAHRPLTLLEVARATGVSPNYLTTLFHAGMGVPLGHFISEERMAQARRALAQPGASVKQVAGALGFTDPFTFSRAFKRVTGRAPSLFRGRTPADKGSDLTP